MEALPVDPTQNDAADVGPPGLDILAIPQIRERFRPDVLSLVLALGSGVAGVISLASGLSSALVGVMIAVALIPPAATLGIGIAWWIPALVLGSGVLLLVNVLSITLAALVALWYMGYRPAEWFHAERTRQAFLERATVLLVSIILLSAFLGAATFASFQTATAEQSVQNVVESVLDAPAYAEYVLIDVECEYSEPPRTATLAGDHPDRGPLATVPAPPRSRRPGRQPGRSSGRAERRGPDPVRHRPAAEAGPDRAPTRLGRAGPKPAQRPQKNAMPAVVTTVSISCSGAPTRAKSVNL